MTDVFNPGSASEHDPSVFTPTNPPPEGWTFTDLLSAIENYTTDPVTRAALLVGSYGETGWGEEYLNAEDPASPGVYGAYQFTPPSGWGLTPEEALDPYTATQGIGDSPSNIGYSQARAMLPASVTNPAAQAEWIAIRAEKPKYDTAELSTIEQTNQPTNYGANSSYTVPASGGPGSGSWAEIQGYLQQMQSGNPAVTTMTTQSGQTVNVPTLAAYTGAGGSDPFTDLMVKLDGIMNPTFGKSSIPFIGQFLNALNPESYFAIAMSVIVKFGIATGFFAVGAFGVLKLASGGQLKASQIPGMAAGFLAGPEAGAMNALSKMGMGGIVGAKRSADQTDIARQRIGLAGRRADVSERRQTLIEQVTPGREARAGAREERQQERQAFVIAGEPGRVKRAEKLVKVRQRSVSAREREVAVKERAQNLKEGNRPIRAVSTSPVTEDDVA